MNELVEDPRRLHSRLRIVTVCPCSTWPIAGQLNLDIDADTSGDWTCTPVRTVKTWPHTHAREEQWPSKTSDRAWMCIFRGGYWSWCAWVRQYFLAKVVQESTNGSDHVDRKLFT